MTFICSCRERIGDSRMLTTAIYCCRYFDLNLKPNVYLVGPSNSTRPYTYEMKGMRLFPASITILVHQKERKRHKYTDFKGSSKNVALGHHVCHVWKGPNKNALPINLFKVNKGHVDHLIEYLYFFGGRWTYKNMIVIERIMAGVRTGPTKGLIRWPLLILLHDIWCMQKWL